MCVWMGFMRSTVLREQGLKVPEVPLCSNLWS